MPYYKNQNNLNLYYEVINKDAIKETPIIMIHGFGSSVGFFSEQRKALGKSYKLILFDAEGHGKSDKNIKEELDAHMITDTVEDLLTLFYLLEIDKPVGILGHSLVGGVVAQKFALLYPKKVEFLILLNSGPMYIDNSIRNAFWNMLPQMVRMEFNDLIHDNLEILLDKTIPLIRNALLNDKNELTDYYIENFDGTIEKEIFNMIEGQIEPSEINCPVLIIGSELDNYAPIWMARILAQKIKGSKFDIIPMAGHFGPSQRSLAYNQLILEFLKELK